MLFPKVQIGGEKDRRVAEPPELQEVWDSPFMPMFLMADYGLVCLSWL